MGLPVEDATKFIFVPYITQNVGLEEALAQHAATVAAQQARDGREIEVNNRLAPMGLQYKNLQPNMMNILTKYIQTGSDPEGTFSQFSAALAQHEARRVRTNEVNNRIKQENLPLYMASSSLFQQYIIKGDAALLEAGVVAGKAALERRPLPRAGNNNGHNNKGKGSKQVVAHMICTFPGCTQTHAKVCPSKVCGTHKEQCTAPNCPKHKK